MKVEKEYFQDIAGSVRFAHMLKQLPEPKRSQPTLRKGEATRAAIVAGTLRIASVEGIGHVTFGSVAKQLKMTRSGVFAHFSSRDTLLLAVLDLYEQQLREYIFLPALHLPRGLARLEAMFNRWAHFCACRPHGDCILVSASMAGQMEPGPVRDRLMGMVLEWQEALRKCIGHAIDAGELRPDTDASQLSYELHGIVLALHQQIRFLEIGASSRHAGNAFRRLIQMYK